MTSFGYSTEQMMGESIQTCGLFQCEIQEGQSEDSSMREQKSIDSNSALSRISLRRVNSQQDIFQKRPQFKSPPPRVPFRQQQMSQTRRDSFLTTNVRTQQIRASQQRILSNFVSPHRRQYSHIISHQHPRRQNLRMQVPIIKQSLGELETNNSIRQSNIGNCYTNSQFLKNPPNPQISRQIPFHGIATKYKNPTLMELKPKMADSDDEGESSRIPGNFQKKGRPNYVVEQRSPWKKSLIDQLNFL